MLVGVAGIAVLVAVCGGWLGVAVTTIVPRPGSEQASVDNPNTPAVNSTIGKRLWFRIMVADYAEQVIQSQTGAQGVTTPQAVFGNILQTVAGQALAAAGYQLQDNAMHQSRGLFRYQKTRADGVSLYVEFQMLDYQGGGSSRFRVNLLRNTGADARSASQYADRIDTTLGKLVWDDFGVRQLTGRDHWWLFNSPRELGFAIAEAGKLLFGFGIPWLEGTLQPDDNIG